MESLLSRRPIELYVTPPLCPSELGDRGRAPPDGLADLEAFELRMDDVERLVLARSRVPDLGRRPRGRHHALLLN